MLVSLCVGDNSITSWNVLLKIKKNMIKHIIIYKLLLTTKTYQVLLKLIFK